MTWATHSLGALNLIFTTVAASTYFVNRHAGDIDNDIVQEFVPLRSSAGALLAYSEEGASDLELDIFCLGDTVDLAKAARAALGTEVLAALNGTAKTYVEQVTSETTARTWKIIGGQVREVSALPGMGEVYGLGGRLVLAAVVHLKLSLN